MRCCCSAAGGVRGLRDRAEQLAHGRPQIDMARVGAFGDLVPRRGLDLLRRRTSFVGQLEKLLAAVGFASGDQALVVQQLQRRVNRTGAGLPDSVAAFGDLLDHLVAVHRPLGQQHQNGRPHVAARPRPRPPRRQPPRRPPGPKPNPGPKPGPKPGPEAGAETRGRRGRRRGRGGVRRIPVGPAAWRRAGPAAGPDAGPKPNPEPGRPANGPSGGVNGVFMCRSPFVCGGGAGRAPPVHITIYR